MVWTFRTWVYCGLMMALVAWPGAVPALAVCVGMDHEAHLVQLGGHHDESIPHEHQHGEHSDAGISSDCCGEHCCTDIPLSFTLDGATPPFSGVARLATVANDVWELLPGAGRICARASLPEPDTGPFSFHPQMNC